jgi:FkbM family methyltransferase
MSWLAGARAFVLPFVEGPARHCLRMAREPAYREHFLLQARLAGLRRHESAVVAVDGMRVELTDAASFLSAHREIFVEEIYRIPGTHAAPAIVDLGANIGLATLWLKRRFPDAQVLALEPDPQAYACLEANVRRNGLAGVELLKKAAWNANTVLHFVPDGADGGFATCQLNGKPAARSVAVEAIAIQELLAERPVDFLKIDIEGAERQVLAACRGILPRVGWLFVEYHGRVREPGGLGELASTIEAAGFRFHVHTVGRRERPFLPAQPEPAFDTQLNVFAWR